MSNVFGVAVYKDKQVVWSNRAYGKTNGALLIASNVMDPSSYKVLVDNTNNVSSVVSEGSSIYYVDAAASKIYRAKHHDGKFEIDMINSHPTKIYHIQVLDKYIYIADPSGLHVLKTSNDKSTKGYRANLMDIDLGAIKPVTFALFRTGAQYIATAVFGALLTISSLTLF